MYPHTLTMKPVLLVTALATLGTFGTASAAWLRLPNTSDRPVSVASSAIKGTSIKSSNGIGDVGALLSEDPVAAASLKSGKSSFIIQLSGQHPVNTISFVNGGAEGQVTISGSADGKKWETLSQKTFGTSTDYVSTQFADSQIKFVKTDFQLSNGGSIRSFTLSGALGNNDFNLKKPSADSSGGGASVNLAQGVGGARPIYASPTPTNMGERGSSLAGPFTFPRTKEKYRTIVYDLGSVRTLREFSATYSSKPVRLQAYAFEKLPEIKDWRGGMTFDPSAFSETKAVATAEDPRGVGHVKLIPASTVSARYIALRFEVNYNRDVASTEATWENFMAFAMEPYRSAASAAGLTSTARFTAGDVAGEAPFTLYEAGIMSNQSGGYAPTSGESSPDSEEVVTDETGSAISEETPPGPGAFMTGAFNAYTNGRAASGGIGPIVDIDDDNDEPPVVPPTTP